MNRCTLKLLVALLFASAPFAAQAGEAKGEFVHKGARVNLRHAYLVTAPQVFDKSKTMRVLVLTAVNIEAKIKACPDFNCVRDEIDDGMTIQFEDGPVLKYWMARNNQQVQHSDTAPPSAFKPGRDEAGHLAGALAIDDSGHGGPKLSLTFDAPLVKALK